MGDNSYQRQTVRAGLSESVLYQLISKRGGSQALMSKFMFIKCRKFHSISGMLLLQRLSEGWTAIELFAACLAPACSYYETANLSRSAYSPYVAL